MIGGGRVWGPGLRNLSRYAVAVAAVAGAVVLTRLLPELVAPMRLFFFWFAVLLTAVIAGLGPAAAATALSVLSAVVTAPVTGLDAIRLALFVLFAGGISFAVGLRRRAQERASQLSEQLRANELRYRTLVEANASQQALWTATPDGRIHWSEAWAAITGQSKEDLESGGGMRVMHADDAARTWEKWKHAVAAETPYEDEVRVFVKGGNWCWFAIRAVPVRAGDRVTEWIGIISNIDERKRHQQQTEFLSRASELLASSLDYNKTLRTFARLCVPALGDWCVIHVAGEGDDYERVAVEHVDPAQVRFVEQLDPRTRPAPDLDPIVQVIRSGEPRLVEYVTDEMLGTVIANDEQRAVVKKLGFRSWIVAPMTTGGRTLGTLTVVHGESGRRYSEADLPFFEDIARRAATAIENARLYEAAEAANRAKDEFLATLSHELRTPLTAIAGWAHMLQMGMADEQTAKLAVDTIVRSARTQGELIDDLLDLSRVVAGTLHLNVTTVDLGPIVEDAIVAARPAADAKNLTVHLANRVALVRGDERRLRQIVWNLVTNAVKFTDEGGAIHIALSLQGRNARFEVADTGRGIDRAFLPYIWERFRQADSSTSRQYGGLGLGLAVVRHLVELHGGTVSVESEGPGKGSRFVVEIPLARLDAAASSSVRAGAKREAPLEGRNVLVVDDDADARVVLTAMLRQQGADVTSAESVQDALRAFEGGGFDAVVSDIAMPGEDGYTLARRIRATQSQVPMIAVSAIATGPGDRDRALGEGFDEFVRKPVDPQQLAEIVRQAIQNRNRHI